MKNTSPEFKAKCSELSVHKNYLLWRNRVIIPSSGEQCVQEMYLTHPKIEQMKAFAC